MPTVKEIVDNIMAPIPGPYQEPPKAQASWATLKVTDVLADEEGTLWEVCEVTSRGARLVAYPPPKGDVAMQSGASIELVDREWQEHGWRKLPKKELRERQ